MSTITEPPPAEGDKQQQPPAKRQAMVVQDESAAAYLFDTARFEHMQRIATAMAAASLLPEHLRQGTAMQTIGNCLLIINQAVRWQLDPYAVAPETYVVRGKLGFQGKLVAAVVNTRAGLVGRLNYTFTGQGDGRTVTVSGCFDNEVKPRTITLSVKQAKTDNKMWRTDPDQKLVYSGVTKWARRHCPEVMLGVLTDDDLERMTIDVDSRPPSASLDALAERLEAPSPPPTEDPPQPNAQADDGNGEPSAPETPPQEPLSEAQDESPVAEGIDEADAAKQRDLRVEWLYREIDGCQSSETVAALIADAEEESSYLGYPRVENVKAHGKKRKRFLAGEGTSSPTTRPPSQQSLIDKYKKQINRTAGPADVQEVLSAAENDLELKAPGLIAVKGHGKTRMEEQEAAT